MSGRVAPNIGEPAAALRAIAASPGATGGLACGQAPGAIGFDRSAPLPARFETISAEDWGRSLAEARATPNALSGQIRMTEAQVLECVLGMIFDHGADAWFDWLEGDDEGHREWLENFREEWLQVHRQCDELCLVLPQHAEKYRWQLGEYVRHSEADLARKLKQFPFNLLARDAREAVENGWKTEAQIAANR